MENILMRFCRETNGYNSNDVAVHLGISADDYHEIETGKALLTNVQARQLEKLFKVKSDYLREASWQLDLLLARNEMIKIQKQRMQELKQQIEDLQKPL